MPKEIEIKIGDETFEAELNDTDTAEEVYDILPVSGAGSEWGNEIYFNIPLNIENENPQKKVEVGDLAYWPRGNGFCILFGRTPESSDEKPVLASPGTVIGKIHSDPKDLRELNNYNIKVRKVGGE